MKNADKDVIAEWISSSEPLLITVSPGEYYIEETRIPEIYKKGDTIAVVVSDVEELQTFIKRVERSISEDRLFYEAFEKINQEETIKQGMDILNQLESNNHMESILLLAFFTKHGIYTLKNEEKSKELLSFASFQEDESTWITKANDIVKEKKYLYAVPYYLAYSIQMGSGEGYYQAGRVFLKNIKNYELCKKCFELAIEAKCEDAKKPYDYICKIGKEQYLKL